MTTLKTISPEDKTQYGSVSNGLQVGSGWDVTVKRESKTLALVNVRSPNGNYDGLGVVEVETETDLQALATEIGNDPHAPGYCESAADGPEDDGWDEIAARWNAIGVGLGAGK